MLDTFRARWVVAVLVVAGVLVPGWAYPPGPARMAPPLRRSQCSLAVAPVDLTLVVVSPPRGLSPMQMRLTAVARKDCADLALSIDLPAGATVAGGTASWRGALARGDQRVLDFNVRVPATGLFHFYGVAESHLANGLLIKQAPCDYGTSTSPQQAPQLPNVITAPDGTRMMVLPAREVSP